MNLAMRDVSTLSNRTKQLSATVPTAQLESVAMSQRIVASNMKYRSMQALSIMNHFLSGVKEQEALTESMTIPQSMQEDERKMMIPVIISESNFDRNDSRRVDIAINDSSLEKGCRDTIKSAVTNTEFSWQKSSSIDSELKSEFNRIKAQSRASERVKALAEKLFLANTFETLNK
jgi:hypothetical protein